MDAYSGIYYLTGEKEQPATFVFLKDRLSIGLVDENGNARVLYWMYGQIPRENFWKNGRAVIRYGQHPVQTIEVESREFADRLETLLIQRERSWISRVMNKSAVNMIKVLALFFSVLIAAYFWMLPFLAERLAKKVPVSYEEQLGDTMYEAMKPGFAVDEARTAYLNDFFKEMKIPTDYHIRITVVKDDIANAYAMPGGYIVVHDQLLAGMTSYEELAALLTHEFTHVNEKHTTRSLFRQMSSAIFLSVILGDAGAVAQILIRNADNLKGLHYSRSLEKEADLKGLNLLHERRIDGRGFIRLFQLLQKESSKTGQPPAEWVSSHPDLEKRIEYIKSSGLVNENSYETNQTLHTLFRKINTGQ